MFAPKTIQRPISRRVAFSLMEIIVVVALLTLSLMAIMAVVNKLLRVEYITENDFIAKGLLFEGLELAEDKRNDNVAKAMPFYQSLTSDSPTEGVTYSMRIDYQGVTSTVTSLTDANARLKYDSGDYYQYTSGTDSKFYRRLLTTFHDNGAHDYLDVESQVYWTERGKSYTQKASLQLYDTNY